ncbi:YqbF domain-containing protein [Sporomusa sp.]|uniref:YqbF domain-containing protein n=1 Tax=Sporomusa sp. TaxID=2078658 RepID=UPI002C6545F5|nr:YqbF domain-containing protein [Sporomusa sp.]HWR07106.1 YqbF domain-containing protein [Sporomusa sp.]
MYIVKLIKGKDYGLLGKLFLAGQEQEVDKKTYNYLKDNHQFEVREEKEKPDSPIAPPAEG